MNKKSAAGKPYGNKTDCRLDRFEEDDDDYIDFKIRFGQCFSLNLIILSACKIISPDNNFYDKLYNFDTLSTDSNNN
jgi:hypothetical protein